MGRVFYFSGYRGEDAFVDHADEVRQQGVEREGWDKTGSEAQIVGPKRRVRQKDAAIGLDTQDVHMGGDRVVTRAELPEFKGGRPTGNIEQVVDRYSDSGHYIGSYVVRWEKNGEGRHVNAGKRRVWY